MSIEAETTKGLPQEATRKREISAEELERAQTFANKGLRRLTKEQKENKSTKCVDGRNPIKEDEGFIARPGGDLGYVLGLFRTVDSDMSLKSLGLTAPEMYNMVLDFVKTEGRKFCWHTDEHESDGHGFGCGHCKKAVENAGLYGVKSEQVSELIALVNNEKNAELAKPDIEPIHHKQTLEGGHNERGVLVVNNPDYAIQTQNESGEQYFVYDKVRDQEQARELVKFLNTRGELKGINISEAAYLKALNDQTNVTLGLLAGDKPLFTVDAKEDGDNFKPNVQGVQVIDRLVPATATHQTHPSH